MKKEETKKPNNEKKTSRRPVSSTTKKRNIFDVNTLRLISSTKTRFLSLLLITFVGACFIAGLSSVSSIMKYTLDKFNDDNNLQDIQIVSNYGFSDEDLDAIKELEDTDLVEGSKWFDCYGIYSDGMKDTIRVQEIDNTINSFVLKEGRLPENENECLALYSNNKDRNIAIGTTVHLIKDEEGELNDVISKTDFTIVGLAETPDYITVGTTTTFHNNSLGNVLFIDSDLFLSDYYTSAYITVDGAKAYNSFNDNYQEYVDDYVSRLEMLSETQKDSNRAAIIEKAQAQLDEAQAELDYQKQLGQTKLDAAKAQLSAAYAKLLMGSASIDAGEEVIDTLEDLYDEKKAQIDEGSAKVEQAKKQVEAKSGLSFDDTFTNMSAVYAIYNSLNTNKVSSYVSSYKDSIQEELDGYNKELEDNKALQEELEKQLSEIIHEISFLNEAQLEQEYSIGEEPSTSIQDEETLTEIIENQSLVENFIDEQSLEEDDSDDEPQTIDNFDMTEYKKEVRRAITRELVALRTEQFWLEIKINIDDEKISLIDNYGNQAVESIVQGLQYELENITGISNIPGTYNNLLAIESGMLQVDASEQLLSETKKLINQTENSIAEVTKQVEDATVQYHSALNEYNNQEEQFNKSIEEAQIKLDKAQQDLDELEEAKWIIVDRTSHLTSTIENEVIDQMNMIGYVIPFLFFLVAILVCLTTMTRLIDEQRGQIGCLLSLGYSKNRIIQMFVFYAFTASSIGSVLGALLGVFTLPNIIYGIWKIAYRFPNMEFRFPFIITFGVILLFVLLIGGVSYLVTRNNLKDEPYTLLRPKAPKKAKKTFIEDIHSIWDRLSLTSKITTRSIFRYKQRFFMTLVGIAGCVTLLITGFGLRDSFSCVLTNFGEVFHYTHYLRMEDSSYDETLSNYLELNIDDSNPVSALSYTTSVTINDDTTSLTVYVADVNKVDNLITFIDNNTNKNISLTDDGVFISNKFADENNLKVGDKMVIESSDGIKKQVSISGIFKCYVGHCIVMSDTYYFNTFGYQAKHNEIFFTYDGDLTELSDSLANQPGFNSLYDYSKKINAMNNAITSLDLIIVIVIIFAGMLTLIVLVSLTEVNISERKRELATLKVLGFSKKDVRNYIFKELIALTIIGSLVGIPFGFLAHSYVLSVIHSNFYYFPTVVNFSSVLISLFITYIFMAIILLIESKPINNIKMVESLKTVE